MADAVSCSKTRIDAIQCRLMAHVAARMSSDRRLLFWETLPDSIPDLTVHLPALAAAVREETMPCVLDRLSFHPLPTILSPESVDWRQGLVAAWEEQLEKERICMDSYISSLRGLIHVERCGLPPGMTCPSILPLLFNELRYVERYFRPPKPPGQFYKGLQALAILAGWRPAPNVMADPVVMQKWADFWRQLYQKEYMYIPYNKPDCPIIIKGIAAKALLNLMETGGEEKTKVPTGTKMLLLESLTMAADIAGEIRRDNYHLDWLDWQPENVTRFPTDGVAKLTETMLKRFRLSCQKPDRWWDKEQQKVLYGSLRELIRWDGAGRLANHPDLLPQIVPDLSGYLNYCMRHHVQSGCFLDHGLCKWLAREEMAAVKGGRELLQKLENHWQSECNSKHGNGYSRCVAWDGRMQLQRTGLATETSSTFQENLLAAIKNEECTEVRLILSIWKLGKETPNRLRRQWECLWQKGLKSDNEGISQTSAVALLRPDLDDDVVAPVIRQQKLRETLQVLPRQLRPKLPVAEVTHLMGEWPTGDPHAKPDTAPNQRWQFRPDETRFRVSTEPAAPASTPINVQMVRPDRSVQSTAGSEPQTGGYYS